MRKAIQKRNQVHILISFIAVTRPPLGTLVCFNPLFVFVINVSLHTPLMLSVEPCEAYQLNLMIKHELDVVKSFCVGFFISLS